jgi:molecular chaperone DnaK
VSDDTRLGNRVPVAMRIRLKYADVETFIEKFSVNFSRGGLFIASKSPKPVGTLLKFEFQLAQGAPVIRGEGEVIWIKPFEEEAPQKPHGMGVRFTRLDPESRAVIDRALAWKESHAKPAPGVRDHKITPPPPPASERQLPQRVPTEARMLSAIQAAAERRADEPAFSPTLPRLDVGDVPPPLEPLAAGGEGDLDLMAEEWGVTPDRIAQTMERVRAEPPADAEIDDLLKDN